MAVLSSMSIFFLVLKSARTTVFFKKKIPADSSQRIDLMSAALAALRVVADWMSVCVRGLLPVHSYDLVTSCTADEEYMVSICLQKIRKRTKGCNVILLPISSYPPFDSQRVSRLLQLTGYVNRIRSDDEWISIALFPIIDPCLSVEPKWIQSLGSISAGLLN